MIIPLTRCGIIFCMNSMIQKHIIHFSCRNEMASFWQNQSILKEGIEKQSSSIRFPIFRGFQKAGFYCI